MPKTTNKISKSKKAVFFSLMEEGQVDPEQWYPTNRIRETANFVVRVHPALKLKKKITFRNVVKVLRKLEELGIVESELQQTDIPGELYAWRITKAFRESQREFDLKQDVLESQ